MEVCDIAVNIGGFKMAWVGIIDEVNKNLFRDGCRRRPGVFVNN
jgi:hypothetical protein